MRPLLPLAAAVAISAFVAPTAHAVPSVGPNVAPQSAFGKRGTGCTYNISVLVTDRRAPVQLLIVDDHRHVVDRLKTTDEQRDDEKRVVEGWWTPRRTGMMRAVAVQNGVRRAGKPFSVGPGLNGGSFCGGV
ncbi:hypothetical protein HUN08_11175 [Gordonia sp. X0973]|uniref:hypothetical protein n=1 Tax=Gordonia sp. X0973 TaxID=2742602 RepID=UPI000F543F00|nr:hypothetical protein [Gordonia sp. X0973]QKT07685.1 hypothetical protein HUN08_11175 [Gordonia sp. X0973]